MITAMATSGPLTILVTASGGHIGTHLIPLLLKDPPVPLKLVLPTSNAKRLRSRLPPAATEDNVVLEEGNIKEPFWVESLFTKHQISRAFLCLTGTDELLITLNFFSAAHRTGTLQHLVYLSFCGELTSEAGLNEVIAGWSNMHMIVKPLFERLLLGAPGLSPKYPWTATILGPTLFFTNDERSRDTLLRDAFLDEPLDTVLGVSRVHPEDIALAARNTLLSPTRWAGHKVMVGSRKQYNGAEIADLWTQALGSDRRIQLCATDTAGLDGFERDYAIKATVRRGVIEAKAWGRDMRLMYAHAAEVGFGMTDAQYAEQLECLGRVPQSYEAWVANKGKEWLAEEAASKSAP